MIVVVDSTALAFLVNPDANPPDDPTTKKPLLYARERIEFMVAGLGQNGTLIIPTPVLAEVLVRAEDGAAELIEKLQGLARVRIKPFDQRAALETAMMTREAIAAGDKRGGSTEPWQKVKFDRQIVAIARINNADRLYADDLGLVKFARLLKMGVVSTWELPLPQTEQDLFSIKGLSTDGSSGIL